MINYLFKSSRRLSNNSQLTEGYLLVKLESIQKELRAQRIDHKDMSLKLEKLLIDKHLQTQVDTYFNEDRNDVHPEDTRDID